MTRRSYTQHQARYASRCSACHGNIFQGMQVTTLHQPTRVLCYKCGRAWRDREAQAEESQRQAAAATRRDPVD